MNQLDADYERSFAESGRHHARAVSVIAGGVTHDSRFFTPFPVVVRRSQGAYKWDLDGHRLLDYWMGHGSLLLGHAHPDVVAAVAHQMGLGSHYGASHRLEVDWAELITAMVPSAELVRFVSSGSEATQLALRLARAYTGRPRSLKFSGHFHGWHDEAVAGGRESGTATAGTAGVARVADSDTVLIPSGSLERVAQVLAGGDVAAVLIEPSGGAWGAVPVSGEFLRGLESLCRQHGTLLIFDEVVTGFRVGPGGAQELHKVMPDLTCFAKVVAGGLPGGAIVGRREVMQLMEYRPEDPVWNQTRKVAHFGTFNANPLSAAAGVATLRIIQGGECIKRADGLCRQLIDALNDVLRRMGMRGMVYGQSSMFHIALGVEPWHDDGWTDISAKDISPELQEQLFRAAKGPETHPIRRAMLLEGVDLMRTGGFLSPAHTADGLEFTARSLRRALERLAAAGYLKTLTQ